MRSHTLCILSVWTSVLSLFCSDVRGQEATFTAPDSVCVGAPVQVKSISPATSYNWNFCISNIDTTPVAINLGNPGNLLSTPVWMSVVQDGANYYAFVINHLTGDLICLSFGTSLLSTPTSQNLGNCGVIPQEAEGIQVIHAAGMWTAIIVGGNDQDAFSQSTIVKVDLGASLAAMTPVGTNWGNLGGLDFPTKLYIFQDSLGVYHGFTDNYTNSTLTEFNFGTSFAAPPTGVNIGNIGGLGGPTGIFSIEDAGNWYLFITNEVNNTLTRLDFGTSLLNTPTPVNLGNPGNTLNGPRDFTMLRFCGKTVAFVSNQNTNDLVKMDFNAGVPDLNPTAESLGNPGGDFAFPHSFSNFFQSGSSIYSFVCNVTSNALTELVFQGCSAMGIPNSTAPTPPPFSYSVPGIYNISLLTDIGLPTQGTYCQSIVVLPPPVITLPADTSFCQGVQVKLSVEAYPGGIYNWSTGSDSSSAIIDTTGTFSVNLNDYGCAVSATLTGTEMPLPVISLPPDTLFCDTGELRYISAEPVTYVWNTASITDSTRVDTSGYYWLQLNEAGCTAIDTVKVTIVSTHEVNLGNDTTYCGPGILQFPDTSQVTYQWNTGSDSSSTPVTSTGAYSLTLNNKGCLSRDTVQITVITLPDIYLPKDTSFCDSGKLGYVTILPVTYTWSTGSAADSTLVRTSGLVKLALNNGGCIVTDSSLVAIITTPGIRLPADTNFCGPGVLQYVSPLPVAYTWSTGSMGNSTPVNNSGTYILELNNQGCVAIDTVICTVIPLPVGNLGDDTAVCLDQPYLISPGINPGGYTYKWQDGSTGQTYPVSATGLYTVAVTANGCTRNDSIYITGIPLPYFSLGGDQPICPGEDIYLVPRPDTFSYVWQDGSSDSLLKVTEPGLYYVTGSNVCGSYMDSVTIYKGICVVHVPNAFTPNGDGINDLFKVLGVEVVDHFELDIYDRYGKKVFESQDKNAGWDGYYNGIAQLTGAYVYELHFRYSITGQSYMIKGTVVLLR